MSALNARRWRVRGQMVATGDSARRCARVDGVYSTPGVDGVYSTRAREARVDGACSARLLDRCGAQACSGSAAVRSSEALRRRDFLAVQPPEDYSVIQALWYQQLAPL